MPDKPLSCVCARDDFVGLDDRAENFVGLSCRIERPAIVFGRPEIRDGFKRRGRGCEEGGRSPGGRPPELESVILQASGFEINGRSVVYVM